MTDGIAGGTAAAPIAVAVLVVLFSVEDGALGVHLLPAGAGRWRLPGRRLAAEEDLEEAAAEVLAEVFGAEATHLEQLYTFGAAGRGDGVREVAVAYFALAPVGSAPARPGRRFAVDGLPPLAGDHAEVVALAVERLRAKIHYSTLGLRFLPRPFTLRELQEVFEAVLGEPLDKRNFRKRMLAIGCIEDTGRRVRQGNHRPARLYRARHGDRVEIVR
ncbi:NUDIX hydrolase [Inmirania thermothiophila]|uniref:8-oxo-dGTP diphosphatase n=1 Tax=Inmirania thermothiophila TaxID=1750597 RepID=A0A3N1XT38_9GAMM|nr:NUDIX hydrolase [Inmirania thermothiophila]ROR29805.1 8-oxo-dGTP diphosphatase [Inmirania thermothiophila]